jgi:flagellar motor component MotA
MNRKTFIDEYTRFLKLAIALAVKAKEKGIASLENEIEDIDDELFKEGLRFVVDEVESRFIDEIMSNKIAHEKDKQMRLLKTIQKRAVFGIQAGEHPYILLKVLCSFIDLTRNEEEKIEIALLPD